MVFWLKADSLIHLVPQTWLEAILLPIKIEKDDLDL